MKKVFIALAVVACVSSCKSKDEKIKEMMVGDWCVSDMQNKADDLKGALSNFAKSKANMNNVKIDNNNIVFSNDKGSLSNTLPYKIVMEAKKDLIVINGTDTMEVSNNGENVSLKGSSTEYTFGKCK